MTRTKIILEGMGQGTIVSETQALKFLRELKKGKWTDVFSDSPSYRVIHITDMDAEGAQQRLSELLYSKKNRKERMKKVI